VLEVRDLGLVDGPVCARIFGRIVCKAPIRSPLTDSVGAGFRFTFCLDREAPGCGGLPPSYEFD